MSNWDIARHQWLRWALEEPPSVPPIDRVDDLDATLRERLERVPFPSGEEPTIVRAAPTASFESMTTLVRHPPARPGSEPEITVQLVAPTDAGELEVTLRPPGAQPDDAADDELYIPPLTKSTRDDAASVTSDAPLPPPPEPAFDEASAPEAIGIAEHWEGARASGELGVAAPEPEPPPPPRRGVQVATPNAEAVSAKTSGVIQTAGEVTPAADVDDDEPRRQKPKIVIDPSASGSSFDQVGEDDVEELDEAAELDDDDLVEEDEPVAQPPVAPRGRDEAVAPPPRSVTEPRAANEPLAANATSVPAPPATAGTIDPSQLAAAAIITPTPAPARTGQTLPPQGTDLAWVDAAFGEHYFALLPENRDERVQEEVDFMLACTGVPAGARVLDVGCGDGAHCFGLASRGMQVTGLDAAMAQLLRAQKINDARGAGVTFVQGDMRTPPVDGPFDLIVCVGSTFGYFDDETNEGVLQQLARRLAPRGFLVLHVFNRDRMVGRLPARSWWQGRGCLVLDEASFDSLTSRMAVHRTMVFEDGRQFDHTVTLRAFGLHDLALMCRRAGLAIVEYSGSIHTRGRFFGATSTDIWLVVRRPDG